MGDELRVERAHHAGEQWAPPVARDLRFEAAEDGRVQRVEEVSLVAHMTIEAHRFDAEAGAEPAHRERLQTLFVHQLQRLSADALAAQSIVFLAGHAYAVSFLRLRCKQVKAASA